MEKSTKVFVVSVVPVFLLFMLGIVVLAYSNAQKTADEERDNLLAEKMSLISDYDVHVLSAEAYTTKEDVFVRFDYEIKVDGVKQNTFIIGRKTTVNTLYENSVASNKAYFDEYLEAKKNCKKPKIYSQEEIHELWLKAKNKQIK